MRAAQVGTLKPPDRIFHGRRPRGVLGLIETLARPGGNLTGVTFLILSSAGAPKMLEVLHEAVPHAGYGVAVQPSPREQRNPGAPL
jgi:hypothetical protein